MNFLLISDYLWYAGHILSGCSILFARNNYNLAISMAMSGQFITIISRPIGRIKNISKLETSQEETKEEMQYDNKIIRV